MRNLLSLPSPNADEAIVNLSDWLELTAWLAPDRNASRDDLKRALQRDGDVTDAFAENLANGVFEELIDREKSCGRFTNSNQRYPYSIDASHSLLCARSTRVSLDNLAYLFLLTITRADMSSGARRISGLDPTKLFENLCGDVLRNFWGGKSDTSDAIIFGTAGRGDSKQVSFRTKIDNLCENIGEGLGWRETAVAPGGGDGKLDVVSWRRFNDGRQGALVGFGQCKTGLHWDQHTTRLQPSTFTLEFMKKQLLIEPMRLYMVPCRISSHRWERHTSDGGLLLDRCRIIQYARPVDRPILDSCKTWLVAILDEQKALKKSVTGR